MHGMMGAVFIRPLLATDALALADCVKSVYDEYGFTWDPNGYHADLYDLRDYVDPEKCSFWVCEEDHQIIGCGGIAWHSVIPGRFGSVVEYEGDPRIAGTEAELTRFYVRSTARRRGIAREIVQLSLDAARDRRISAIEIWSDKRFVEAHALYQKRGATIVGERVCPGDPDESVEFGLILKLDS